MGGGQAQGLPLPVGEGGKEGVSRMGQGRHKAGTYRWVRVGKEGVSRMGEGRHKAGTYRWVRGGGRGVAYGGGQAQGRPLPVGEGGKEGVSRMGGSRRAGTRPAPTGG